MTERPQKSTFRPERTLKERGRDILTSHKKLTGKKKRTRKIRNKQDVSRTLNRIGDLNESRGETLLRIIKENRKITSFRKADGREQSWRCDYIVTIEDKTFGLQIKSSDRGIAEFFQEERIHPIRKRPYGVLAFRTNISSSTDNEEAKRLADRIKAFLSQVPPSH